MFLRNDGIGLNSDGSDTNPPRLHAVAEGDKLTAMANHTGRWEAHWRRQLPNLRYPPGMGKMPGQCNVATREKAEETQGGCFLSILIFQSKSWGRSEPRRVHIFKKSIHLGCKSHAEILPCCQIGLPISLGKRPSLLLVTTQPEWGCEKNNAGEGSRKVRIDPTYLRCGITRKEICRVTPVGNDQWCSSRLCIALTTGLVFWMQYSWIVTVTIWLLTS